MAYPNMYSSFSSSPERQIDYPFLYSFAASVLQKLDQYNLDEFVDPNDMQNDVEMLKGILTRLPSILKTHDDDTSSIMRDIQNSVFGLHDFLNKHPSSSWKDLVAPLTKFQDHKHPESSKEEENLLSSLSVALPHIESQDVKVNNLPLHLVPCLAYCALYPIGNRIARETLVNQWMAEGFLELQTPGSSSGSGDLEMEDVGNRYFMELLSMGVFVKPIFGFRGRCTNQQAVTVHSCEIHPDMHDLACQMADKEVRVIKSSKTSQSNMYIGKPYEGGMFEDHKRTQKRETTGTKKIVSPFAGGTFKYTQQRETIRTMYIALHRRPEIHEWRSFNPQRTCMFFVPLMERNVLQCLGFCLSLQILDLSGTLFKELPPGILWHGARLRYLAFSKNPLLKRLNNIDLSSLQTLAVDGCVQLEKVNIKHTSRMRHLYYTSKETTLEVHTSTLRILQLSYCSELRWFLLSNFANFNCLRRLRIFECPRLISLPDSMNLLKHVEELVFHNCARLDLNCVRSMDSLPSLHYMELIGLPKLTELPAGLQFSRALHYLIIGDCKSLRSTDHVLQHLDTLQKLCVYDCPTFSIAPNAFDSLTALQSLDIRKCPNIKITSTSDAGKQLLDQVEIMSEPSKVIHVRNVGHEISESGGLSREDDAALGPQMSSFGAQTDSLTPTNFPYFILSFETFEKNNPSEEMLFQKYKLKVISKWKVLAQALKAVVNLRILQQQTLYCCLFPNCSLFPIDYEFERETLFQLWMVRGFFPKHRKRLFKRLLLFGCIRRRRIDISTGIRKYTIDVGKVAALSNSFKSKDHYTLIEDEDTELDRSTSWYHVSIASKSIDKTRLETLEKFSELRTLLLVRDYGSSLKQIPPKFFIALHNMQVLDLSGCHISELPSTIKYMTHLRFLDLSFTLIERLPESIQFLQELQTLKLIGCKHLHTLPKGMTKLVNLYHLDFDVLGQLTSMPKGLGFLTKLCTLSAFIVSREQGCRIRELKDMNNLRGSLCISGLEYATIEDAIEADMIKKKRLTRLHLKWSHSKCHNEEDQKKAWTVLDMLEAPSSLTKLQISNYPGSVLRERIQWLNKLVSITLLKCDIKKIIALDRLPKLKHLNFYDINKATDIDSLDLHEIPSFPALKTLTMDSMRSLQRWNGWTKLKGGLKFPKLSKVIIKDCPCLSGLLFLSHLPSLTYLEISDCKSFESLPEGKLSTSLKTLIIDKCPSLKTRCSEGGDDWEKIEHVKDIWIDMKHIRSSQEDKDSLSEHESGSSDDESGSSDDESESLEKRKISGDDNSATPLALAYSIVPTYGFIS